MRTSEFLRRMVLTLAFLSIPGGVRANGSGSFPVHVFHHICENGRLAALLRVHPQVSSTDESARTLENLCTIGDFGFRRAGIYLELFARPGSDRVTLLTSPLASFQSEEARTLFTITVSDSQMVIRDPAGSVERFGCDPGCETRLWLQLDRDTLSVSSTWGERRLIRSQPISERDRLFLGIPTDSDSCETCSLGALDIYLDDSTAKEWFSVCGEAAERGRPWHEK